MYDGNADGRGWGHLQSECLTEQKSCMVHGSFFVASTCRSGIAGISKEVCQLGTVVGRYH